MASDKITWTKLGTSHYGYVGKFHLVTIKAGRTWFRISSNFPVTPRNPNHPTLKQAKAGAERFLTAFLNGINAEWSPDELD